VTSKSDPESESFAIIERTSVVEKRVAILLLPITKQVSLEKTATKLIKMTFLH
jgi:hypothetical protein